MPSCPPIRRQALALLCAILPCVSSVTVRAQEATASSGRPFAIEKSASLKETITDNRDLASTNKQAESITETSVGVQASANSARLKGFLDYTVTGIMHSRGSTDDAVQQILSTAATAEIVRQHAYVDVAGSISQQVVSIFGTRSPDTSLANPNRAEVRTFSVSPYLLGRLGSVANYEARVSYSNTSTSASSDSGSSSTSASARLSGATPLTVLSWSTEFSHSESDFVAGRRTEEDLARAVLTWAVKQDLALSAIGGREANNYVSLDKQWHSFYGVSGSWRPSERTTLSGNLEHHYFGNSHAFSFAYRTPRTAWSFSDVRGVSSTPNQPVLGSLGTIYDLFFQQFASVQPDPVLRQQLVNNFLRANGIDPTVQIFANFLVSSLTLQRTQTLSFALLGLRDTVTFTAGQGETNLLDTISGVTGDFANTNVIRQRVLSVDWAHRLTPTSAVSATGSYQRASGSLESQTTTLKSLTALWTNDVGRRTSVSLGGRHVVFGSATSPYVENAIFGTIAVRF